MSLVLNTHPFWFFFFDQKKVTLEPNTLVLAFGHKRLPHDSSLNTVFFVACLTSFSFQLNHTIRPACNIPSTSSAHDVASPFQPLCFVCMMWCVCQPLLLASLVEPRFPRYHLIMGFDVIFLVKSLLLLLEIKQWHLFSTLGGWKGWVKGKAVFLWCH